MSSKYIAFIILISIFYFCEVAISKTIAVSTKNITSLETQWKVKKGDAKTYKDINFDDTTWKTITVPSNLMSLYSSYRGIAWYRINLSFKKNNINTYLLELGKICDVDETYFNGILIGKTGEINNPQSHGFDRIRYYTIPNSLIRKGTNILAIRTRGYLHDSAGLIWGHFRLGPSNLIRNKLLIHNSIDAMFIATYIFIFFYFLFFSLFKNHLMKQQRTLAILSLFFAIYLFCVGQLKYLFFDNFILFHKLQYAAGITLVIYIAMLIQRLYHHYITIFDKILFVILGNLILVIFFIPEISDLTIPRYIWHISLLYTTSLFIYKLFTHKSKKYLSLHIGFIIFIIISLLEIFRSHTILPDFDYFQFGLLALITNISFFLAEEVSQSELMEKRIRTTLEEELDKKTHMIVDRNQVIEQDLDIARKIQSKLLPDKKNYPGPFSLYSYYKPVDTVGGDFYDLNTSDKMVQIIIADVAGHGVPGAMLGMITKIAFDYTKEAHMSHEEILKELNKVIFQASVMSFFVTLFLCTLNIESMTLHYSNAGHIPQVLYKRNQNTMIDLYSPGKALGWIAQSSITTKSISLESGDRLYLFTDGIIECMNDKKRLLGEKGFKDILDEAHHLTGDEAIIEIMEKINLFCENTPIDDDITLLIIDIA